MKPQSPTGTKLDTTTRGHSWRMSFTTSCVRGNAAKARAALHARMEAHRNLHACSTRARRIRGSDLAFARARSRRKIWVSLDQRPPTSPARTTNRARARGPTSSGYVRSFLRRARVRTAPSICAAPGLADPSQWSGETSVVSTASCIPPKRGKPSATISSRRLS